MTDREKVAQEIDESEIGEAMSIDGSDSIDSLLSRLRGAVKLYEDVIEESRDPNDLARAKRRRKEAAGFVKKLERLKSKGFSDSGRRSPSRLRTGSPGRSFGKKGRSNMARKRSFKAFGISLPAVGNPTAILKYNVQAQDVLVGAIAGLVGSSVAKKAVGFVLDKLPFQLPPAVVALTPLLSTSLVGAGLYYGQKKSARGKGHLVGAITAGAALTAWDLLKAHYPQYFNEVVELQLNGYLVNDPAYHGVIVNDRALNGIVVNDPQRALSDANLAELAAASMDDAEDYTDVDQLMS